MRLGAVDADGDLGAGGAELLEQSAVSPDPQVLLRYLHLRARTTHRLTLRASLHKVTENNDSAMSRTYGTQVARARSGVQAEKQPRYGNHVVLNERLAKTKRSEYKLN